MPAQEVETVLFFVVCYEQKGPAQRKRTDDWRALCNREEEKITTGQSERSEFYYIITSPGGGLQNFWWGYVPRTLNRISEQNLWFFLPFGLWSNVFASNWQKTGLKNVALNAKEISHTSTWATESQSTPQSVDYDPQKEYLNPENTLK